MLDGHLAALPIASCRGLMTVLVPDETRTQVQKVKGFQGNSGF